MLGFKIKAALTEVYFILAQLLMSYLRFFIAVFLGFTVVFWASRFVASWCDSLQPRHVPPSAFRVGASATIPLAKGFFVFTIIKSLRKNYNQGLSQKMGLILYYLVYLGRRFNLLSSVLYVSGCRGATAEGGAVRSRRACKH